MPKPEVFTSKDACDFVGIPRRLLNYMVEAGLVTPSVRQGEGTGSRRLFSFSDLLQVEVARFFSRGADTEVVRHALELLRAIPDLENLDDRDAIIWDRKGDPRLVRFATREEEIAARERGEAMLTIGVGLMKHFLRRRIDTECRYPANPTAPDWAAEMASTTGRRGKV